MTHDQIDKFLEEVEKLAEYERQHERYYNLNTLRSCHRLIRDLVQVRNEEVPGLTDPQFRALLGQHMRNDPKGDERGVYDHAVTEKLLDTEARLRGFNHWLDAYHNFKWPGKDDLAPGLSPFRPDPITDILGPKSDIVKRLKRGLGKVAMEDVLEAVAGALNERLTAVEKATAKLEGEWLERLDKALSLAEQTGDLVEQAQEERRVVERQLLDAEEELEELEELEQDLRGAEEKLEASHKEHEKLKEHLDSRERYIVQLEQELLKKFKDEWSIWTKERQYQALRRHIGGGTIVDEVARMVREGFLRLTVNGVRTIRVKADPNSNTILVSTSEDKSDA